jgi:acetoacetate decarboxylase
MTPTRQQSELKLEIANFSHDSLSTSMCGEDSGPVLLAGRTMTYKHRSVQANSRSVQGRAEQLCAPRFNQILVQLSGETEVLRIPIPIPIPISAVASLRRVLT